MPGHKDWLQKASADLKLATKATNDTETIDPAVYLAHQCAEKSLKTFFVFRGKSVPKTHFLGVLLDDCTKFDAEFMLIARECAFLEPFGFSTRYPNDTVHVNQDDLHEALFMSKKVFGFVSTKVQEKSI